MKLLIGCPISDRAWILPKWFEHCYISAENAQVDIEFVFVASKNDKDSLDVVTHKNSTIVMVDEAIRKDHRTWNISRYEHMCFLRNSLLSEVRTIAPTYFLSLDSDILLHPNAISSLLDASQQHPGAWAIGGKCYLSTATRYHPNMGTFKQGQSDTFTRKDSNALHPVDILMAIKLMKPESYNIDYVVNRLGEDIGWSKQVIAAGGSFFWDGRVANKHIMDKKLIDKFDERVGF